MRLGYSWADWIGIFVAAFLYVVLLPLVFLFAVCCSIALLWIERKQCR